jgi:16S rRNA (cytidine1402-2'-O)-methyltransferase
VDVFGGDRPAFVAREMTKKFETYLHGTLDKLLQQVSADSNQQRGEIVLVVGGEVGTSDVITVDAEKIIALLMKELPLTKAASIAAKITGGDKKQLYNLALSLQNK